MAKSDFEIQSASGQLWPDLIEWRDAAVAVVTASLGDAIAKCAAIEAKAKDPTATIADVLAEVEKEAEARRREEIQRRRDEAAAILAKLDEELNGK